jgi:hypothetical protein
MDVAKIGNYFETTKEKWKNLRYLREKQDSISEQKRSLHGLLFIITLFFVANSLDSSTCPRYQQYVLHQTILRSSRQS